MAHNEFSKAEIEKLVEAAGILVEAEKPLAVIHATSWPPETSRRFFAGKCRELPRISYTPIDPARTFQMVAEARRLISGDSPVHQWLLRLADVFDETARLIANLGAPAFHEISCRLFGSPDTLFSDGVLRTIDLAERIDSVLSSYADEDLMKNPELTLSAAELQERFNVSIRQHFKENAPRVEIVETLSARAVAGRDYIRLRADCRFSELDAVQLLQHEAFVHIATGNNGKNQFMFPILGEAHPGNTRTQEGLAVFAEFISGALGPHRLRRLAGRVLGIKMSMDGANFLELFEFYQERGENRLDSFDMARRVVRGGLVEGGAPFTKDVVYLGGLLDVHNYLRTVVRLGDASLVRILFYGKFELTDLEAIVMLRQAGVLNEPRVLAPWADDMGKLVSYLTYSTFLNEVNLDNVSSRYDFLANWSKL
ncbi:MAG: hypothetical protein A3G18_13495 [Rhodospirillales bacterium RIFCSPLOWO2_12_FULL_58_28]|nr:MAG: hypothetical protein A3H92_13350 [Rhodospirillales bacterium RIFCSPLOWO2_02_FULL_58_16]OHC78587.1 MAG: hypothetical protein A3G18_13495 [Rhodospirillales bacterium RIFCSPLOWO2_12_FULL_58_28]